LAIYQEELTMPKLAANLTMLFTDVPFLDRFAAAKQAGFTYVEFLFPYDHPAEKVKEALDKNGLQVINFNLPCGNWTGVSAPSRAGWKNSGPASRPRWPTPRSWARRA
jgi:hydroxypyruvate isomerase